MKKREREKKYEELDIVKQLNILLDQIYLAEDEEEADLYLFQLHMDNEIDMAFFSHEERMKIREMIMFLMHETKKHRAFLAEAARELHFRRKNYA
ncbi:MAG: hypothetical protein COV74_10730 [Candidatus Omnitrophica bacterium CG11_big_fil_rev_8_21_14_0_20_45_26]|uniref:Uncharacterized protein n=1 Tax=Candidatus Abzuiibacterium crystallinum TaxID=1974748 RepID=A0A2H0LKY1_9BACT|nr:MAG: hypothetical protein COV74_10730 [Candidatus Omnitrophica bacterium CG11_big_fil_rev_8_21_14_0_20_45_26]PIW63860.1 MAG: hypothetical protein COW12_08080 [Candidatus Omnitrophica bacterium CG12_big_fil_rev_8_21_14_0_65_45_16]